MRNFFYTGQVVQIASWPSDDGGYYGRILASSCSKSDQPVHVRGVQLR